jgi:arylamine N-acetyltransferase
MVNIVTIDKQKYLVDVGFGANGTWKPLPLSDGFETSGIGSQQFKMSHSTLPEHTDRSQKAWVYSYRETEKAPWIDAYAFAEIEFFPADYAVMNLSTMTLRQSFFVQTLFCVKMLLDEETKQPTGWLTLHHDIVKKTKGPETLIMEHMRTEDQRIAALKRWFNIQLTDAEKRGIRDLYSELRGFKMGP